MAWMVNATPRPLYPRERPGTYCIGGWVGPRGVLDADLSVTQHNGMPNIKSGNFDCMSLNFLVF